jgi:hypothetical protein
MPPSDDLRTIPNYAPVLRPVEILLRLTRTRPSVEFTKVTPICRAFFHSCLCWFVFFRYSTLFTFRVPSFASETIRRYVLGLTIQSLDCTGFIYIQDQLPPLFSQEASLSIYTYEILLLQICFRIALNACFCHIHFSRQIS